MYTIHENKKVQKALDILKGKKYLMQIFYDKYGLIKDFTNIK